MTEKHLPNYPLPIDPSNFEFEILAGRRTRPTFQALRDTMDIWLIQSYYEQTVENYAGDARKAINWPELTVTWV